MEIRSATGRDWPQIWEIFREVVARGDTYAYDPDTTEAVAKGYWTGPAVATFVATEGDEVVGTYVMKPAQPGLGSHVANAGFMVPERAGGRGVGRRMAEHALVEAKRAGYLAMQFNFVVSTNVRAVALWKALGFQTIGTAPKAYRHATEGLVDVYIMHRFL